MGAAVRFGALLLLACSWLTAGKIPGRYIVELTGEPVTEHMARLRAPRRLKSAEAVAQRLKIRTEQQSIRRRLERRGATVLGSVDTVANAVFVSISDQQARQLASEPGVKRVIQARTFHMLLDRAAVVHKIVDAWNQVGEERAGAGVKIAIIDSGIDKAHPGFQDPSLETPQGFPLAGASSDLAYTSNKVIVARSYVDLLPYRDPDYSAADHLGHGTALAMVAAGVRNTGPLATITGVAPRAWVGNYKIFGTPEYNDGTSDEAILKAIDDAVADGMDIINLSLGSDFAPRLSDDVDVQAVERATQAGVIVVAAAGNSGPDLNTMSSPATAPSVIAAGATTNARVFAASVTVDGLPPAIAYLSDGTAPSTPVTGLLTDVSMLDGNGQACASLPDGSLSGRVALIARGTCTFQAKLVYAQRAGAVAAVVHTNADAPQPFNMATSGATLPAEMISYDDAVRIKKALETTPDLNASLSFTLGPVESASGQLTDFSAAGPNVDLGIKPDLLAVGSDLYVATQKLDNWGAMYNESGYKVVQGTSFSSPLVAGAAALLKSARPGLSVHQYRSLLINSATPVQLLSGVIPPVQLTGAGVLNVAAAINSTVAAYPVSLSFGSGGADLEKMRTLWITNLGSAAGTFTISAAPNGDNPGPVPSQGTFELAPGASVELTLSWTAYALAAGPYQGALVISSATNGVQARVPYWYASTTNTPAKITVLSSTTSGRRGGVVYDVALFRVTDASGLALTDIAPTVTVTSGGGKVGPVNSYDSEVPGVFGIDVQLGLAAGTNVFRIQAGDAFVDLSVTGR
jgi:minor extracellular serine protease Vpr